MRIVAYLCLSFCLLSFDIHASSAPLVIKQGIEKQEFTVAITNEAKPAVEFEIEEDGLLIIEVKQRGHFLYERLWIDGKPQAYMDMFGFSEGSDFISKQVNAGEKLGIEIKSSTDLSELTSIDLNASIVSNTHHQFDIFTDIFLVLNQLALKTQQAYTDSGPRFKTLVNETYQLNNQALQQLSQLPQYISTKNYLLLNQAVLLSDLGQRKASFGKFSALLSLKKGKSHELLSNYYVALLLPDYLEKDELLTKLDKAIIQAKGYNFYLYQNARMDKCTALQQQSSSETFNCFNSIIEEQLLQKYPLKLAVLEANLANYLFSNDEYSQAISFGESSLRTIEKIKDAPETHQSYKIKKAIFEYQQSLRLKKLGLENEALHKLLSSIQTFILFNQSEFLLNALIELGDIYQEHGQSEIALYLAKYVLGNRNINIKNDHYKLVKHALYLASKSSLSLHQTDSAKRYIQSYQQHINTNDHDAFFNIKILQHSLPPNSLPLTALIKEYELQYNPIVEQATLLLRFSEILIDKKIFGKAEELLFQVDSKKLNFKNRIKLNTLKSKLALSSDNIKEAGQYIDNAVTLIEQQFNELKNLGVKRFYYDVFKSVYIQKSVIQLEKYKKTKNTKYLIATSALNMPRKLELQYTQYKNSSNIERQKIAENLSSTSFTNENTLSLITALLQLENQYHRKSTQIAPKPFINETQLKLNDKTAVLHYVLMPKRSLLFIYKNKRIEFHWLPSEKEINNKISLLFELLEKSQSSAFIQAKKLAHILLPSTLMSDQTSDNLIIIGSGLIWQLPFSLLPLENSRDWQSQLLLDKFVIKKSLSLEISKSFELSEIEQVISINDPIFSPNDQRAVKLKSYSENENSLSRIKSSAQEALSIKRHLSNIDIIDLSGFSATKENFKKNIAIGKSQIIHIASHSYSSAESFRKAGIFFTAFDEQGKKQINILSLHEIEQIPQNAQLIVLSSCKSNVGKTSFKAPVDGLALAFINGGGNNVVASQWQTPSRATATLIDRFYKRLKDTNSIEHALNFAQKETRKKYKNPYYWAGFTLTSNNIGE